MFESVLLGGGGVSSIAHLSFLGLLRDHSLVSPRATLIGVSAGSIVALAAVLGVPPPDAMRIAHAACHDTLRGDAPDFDIAALISSFGLLRITPLVERIVSSLVESWWWRLSAEGHRPASRPATLSDLELSCPGGHRLEVVVTDAVRMQTLVISAASHPAARIVDVIAASCAIPILFAPVAVHDTICLDGAALLGSASAALVARLAELGPALVLQIVRDAPRPDEASASDFIGFITSFTAAFAHSGSRIHRTDTPNVTWWDTPAATGLLSGLVYRTEPHEVARVYEGGKASFAAFLRSLAPAA